MIDFVSLYIELPVMLVMYAAWMLVKSPAARLPAGPLLPESPTSSTPLSASRRAGHRRRTASRWWHSDLVDVNTVDLIRDEHQEEVVDKADDEERERRVHGKARLLWKIYYWLV